MKRFLVGLVAISILVSAMPLMANAAFPDMPADHWAAVQVERLVSEGTINGMPDGTFNPTGVVSRAEFVKMLGKSDVKFEKNFADVPSGHWAYDYIMHSQLEGDNRGNFNPTSAITRGEVANLIYKRFANGAVTKAPYYISSQGTNSNATAWVYNTGLMVGGDYLNLRMEDTLTRAEAAVLIVRAKEINPTAYNSFVDKFSAEVYKNVYDNSGLFDTPYAENENITYEELATAAMRYQFKYKNPALRYEFSPKYDGEYAKYWDVACNYALDEKNYGSTKESAEKYAIVEDAVAILSLGAKNNTFINGNVVEPDGKTYSDVVIKDAESNFAGMMSYAYNFGITLNSGSNLNAKSLITKKQVSAIIMQYSLSFGSQTGYHCGYNSGYILPYTRLDSASYPANRDFYANIADSIPNYVYEKPFKTKADISIQPREFASTASMLSYTYATTFMYVVQSAYEKGADVYIDFYPGLSLRLADNTEQYRVKLTVEKAFEGMKLSDILPLGEGMEDRVLSAGDSFWCDVNSNQSTIGKLYIDYTIMSIDQIVE